MKKTDAVTAPLRRDAIKDALSGLGLRGAMKRVTIRSEKKNILTIAHVEEVVRIWTGQKGHDAIT